MNWYKQSWFWSGIGVLILVGLIFGSKWKPTKKNEPFFGQINGFCVNDVCLKRELEKWWMTEGDKKVPADNEKTDQMIKQLGEIKLDTVVSKNKEREKEMGFDDFDKVVVKAVGKSLEVGTIGSDYESTLVRKAGEVTVYAVNAVWNRNSLKDANYWKNSRVTNLASYQLKTITKIRDGKETTLDLKNSLVDKILHLNAVDYLAGKPIDAPIVTYKVVTETDSVALIVGKQWATTDENIYYTIAKSDFDLLTASR